MPDSSSYNSACSNGERAPPSGSAEAGAAATGVLDEGERSAMSRDLVAKKLSESNRVTGTQWEQGGQLGVGSRDETFKGGNGGSSGEDIEAGVTARPPLSCVKQSATSGTMPAPGDGCGAA